MPPIRPESLWSAAMRVAPKVFFLLDREGTITFASPSEEPEVAAALGSMVGRSAFDFCDERDHDLLRDVIARAWDGRETVRYRLRSRNAVGEATWYQSSAGPVIEDGAVRAVMVVTRDIAEIIETERHARESSALIDAIGRTPGLMFALVRPEGEDTRILEMSEGAASVVGTDPQRVRGRTGLESGFDPELVRQTSAVYRDVLAKGVSRSFECAIGEGRWFIGTAHPIRTGEDQPPCCLVVGVEHTPLRQARTELERQHERYRTIFDSSLIGIILSDAHRTILEANPAMEKMLGYEPGELIGKHGSIITPPYNRERVAEYVGRAAPGEISSGIWPAIRKDGTEFFVQIDSMRLATGGRLGLFRDVTELQRIERERQTEHERFRTVFMDAPTGIVRFDGAGTIIDVNPAYAELAGRSREALIGTPLGKLAPAADLPRLAGELARVMAGGVHRGLWTLVRPDGTERQIEAHSSLGADGIITNFVRDLTELRAAQAQRDAEQERYRRMFMEASVPMTRVLRDGTLEDVNPAYERLSGRPRSDLIGRDLRTLCTPEDAARLGPALASLRADEPHRGEWTLVRPDGRVVPIEVQAFAGEDGVATGFVTDLTERREAADALARSEAKFRQLFERHPDPVWVYDLDTMRFLEVNHAAIAQYGYPREQFLAMTLEDIRPESDRISLREAVAERREGRGPTEPRAWTHRTADGSLIEVETAGAETEHFPGKRARIVVARNVTKLREAEREIRERDQWLGFVQDFIGAGLFRWDALTDVARGSTSHMELHGVEHSREGLTFARWLRCMLPEDRERVQRELREMERKSTPDFRVEYRVQHPTRGVRWLTEIGRREFDAQGRVVFVAGVSLDITEQKQREERARRTEDRLREVLRAPDIGVWEHDLTTDEQWWSDSLYAIAGLGERQPVPGAWRARIHPDDRERVAQLLRQAHETRGPRYEAEYRVVRPDGEVRHVIDRGELVTGADGHDRYVGVTIDVTKLRQAEEQSRRALQRLGAMIEATGAGAWECTITGEEEWWSPEARALLGVGPDELVGDSLWISRVHPEDRDHVRAEYRALLQRRTDRCTSEYRIVRPDGQVRWVLDNSAVVNDPTGGPARIVGVVLDITERRAEEEARRAAETRLSLAVSTLGCGVWEWSAQTGESRWSAEIWRMLGVEPFGRPPTLDDWREFIHPDERDRVYERYTRALAEGTETVTLEYRIIRADGAVRWVLDAGRFRLGDSGRAVSGVGMVIDVTERHAAEERRRETERDLSMALRHVGAGLWTSDRVAGVSHWSAELWAIIGRKPDSFAPSAARWLAVVHPDDREQARASFAEAIERRQPTYQNAFRVVRPDGRVRHLIDAARLRFSPEGAYLGAVGVVLDITERIEREGALNELNLRLRDAEAAGACGSWDWDFATGQTTWSENQWRLYGYIPRTDVATLDLWRSVVRPEDVERVLSIVDQTRREGKRELSCEFRIRTPDGSERWIGSRARIVYNDAGLALRASGVDTDITERKAAEERESRYRHSLEAQIDRLRRSEQVAGAGTWEVDMVSGEAFWSDNQWRLYGLAPGGADVRIPNWLDVVHAEDRWAPLGVLQGIQSGAIDQFSGCEFRTTLPDGTMRWIEAAGKVFRDESGRPVRLTGVNIDITARKDTERELIESRSMLQQAQRAASLGAWVSDEDGTLWWSDEVHEIFGTTPGAFRPSTSFFFGLVHPDDRDAVREADARARQSATRYALDHRIVRPDGSIRWVHEQADVFPGPHGTRMVGIVQDITERKRLEQQLAHAQKMESVGRLAGGLAHDFNNSLTAILGFADLARSAAEVSHARAALDGITRAASHARDLTAQILAFSRRRILTPQVVNLASLVTNLQPVLGRLMGEPIRVRVRAGAYALYVTVDPGSIEQVLLNLSFNARDAMPSGGVLEISVAEVRLEAGDARLAAELAPGSYVELRVADTGMGMTREVRDRCFEPFFSTKSGRSDSGAGLGLAMCYGVVRQSGGVITVESEPGRGTTFSIVLPGPVETEPDVAASAPVIEARPLRSRDGGRRPCVMLVEDNELVRDVNGQVLRAAGYRVEEFPDGRSAIDAVRAGLVFDLLLADVVLPDIRGTEVAARIREIRRDVPVLLVSGYAEEHATAGLPQGVQFLQKPFTPAQLTARLESILAGTVR
ncbi:MAG: PAS domain S-box protein [Planctomycetota bacterium]|nr:PAS domain S-box protein [Planctomycetota bacterium]